VKPNPSIFFPEVVPAVMVFAASPVWLAQLLFDRKLFAASVLFAGVACTVGLLVAAYRHRSKGLAYAAIILVLIAAYGANRESR
jgi:hypothetical protein